MRVHNFSAGPCTLPLEVLEEAQAEFVDYHGAGMSLIEMSHRSKAYDGVHHEAMRLARSVFGAPDDFEVLFVGGGATLQFAMVPLNLLGAGRRGAYVDTGVWASRAIEDGAFCGDVYTAWDGSNDGYVRTPEDSELTIQENTRYLHITTNETIGGIRFPSFPDVGLPLVADMSSEYMSRPIPWDRFDIVYGGAQKNLGPAGVDITFVRTSILEETNRDLAAYLRFDVHAAKDSMFNTPPVFAIYMVGKVLDWVARQGGVEAMQANAAAKSGALYRAIDGPDGFYRSPVEPRSRSHMNVVFRLPSEELEARFVAGAAGRGLVNLKGHRSVGGIRASIYNAMPEEGVSELVDFMEEFRTANG